MTDAIVDLAHRLEPVADTAPRPTATRSRGAAKTLPAPAKVLADGSPNAGLAEPGHDAGVAGFSTHWTRVLYDDIFARAPAGKLPGSSIEGAADNVASAYSGDDITSYQMYLDARNHRSFTLGAIVLAMLEALAASARRVYARYRKWRRATGVYDALSRLDDRTLRDLGFDRSEIRSVAAEFTREAESTRLRLRLAYRPRR